LTLCFIITRIYTNHGQNNVIRFLDNLLDNGAGIQDKKGDTVLIEVNLESINFFKVGIAWMDSVDPWIHLEFFSFFQYFSSIYTLPSTISLVKVELKFILEDSRPKDAYFGVFCLLQERKEIPVNK